MYLWRAGSGEKSAGREKLAGPGRHRAPSSGAWGSAAPDTPPPGRRGKQFSMVISSKTRLNILCIRVCVLSHVRLCDPVDWSPPGSSVHGILQARVLEWVAVSSSKGSSRPRDQTGITGRFFPAVPPGKLQNITLSYSKFMLFHPNHVKLKCKH